MASSATRGNEAKPDIVASGAPDVAEVDSNGDEDQGSLPLNTVTSSDVVVNSEDDEVVREIPVFLSADMSKKLHLIQYPLQQQQQQQETRPSIQPSKARIKPRHCMMEVEFTTPEDIEFNGLYHMPSRTFSSHIVPVSTHLALGRLLPLDGSNNSGSSINPHNLGLHLVPLSRITQLRPNFAHVDEEAASTSATPDDEIVQQHQAQDDANQLERKIVSFQKKESERAALARKSSYGFKKSSEDAEMWHHLEVHDSTSSLASQIMENVKCPNPDRSLLEPSTLLKSIFGSCNTVTRSLTERYVNTLNYLPPQEQDDSVMMSTNSNEANLPSIVAKLVQVMHLGWPIPFSLLRLQFPDTVAVSDATLFVALGSCAVLVRGNFCLSSRLLRMSPAIAQARTFLLFLFQSMRVVHRERLEHVYASENNGNGDDSVTPAVIGMLLEQLGKKTDEGWILKVDDDTTFGEKYPETLLVHVQHWANQMIPFQHLLQRYRDPMGIAMDES